MEILFKREDLLAGLSKVADVAASRNTLPILKNILVRAKDDGLMQSVTNGIELFATNLEIGVRYSIEGTIVEPGEITIPARKFIEIIRELSNDDEPVKFKTTSNDRIELVHGKSKFRLIGLPCDEFPPMAEIDRPYTIDYADLHFLFSRAIGSVSTEETRHFLNGVYWNTKDGRIFSVGTDGRRLVVASKPSEANITGVIIPATAVTKLLKIFDGGIVSWGVGESQMLFAKDGVSFITRLIEGEYPDYEAVLAPVINNPIVIFGDAEKIGSAVKRVALMSDSKTAQIRLEIGQTEMGIKSQTADVGEAEENVPVTNTGDPIDIGLNSKYLLLAISFVQGEVCMKLKDAGSPVLIKGQTEDYMSVVMPMRL